MDVCSSKDLVQFGLVRFEFVLIMVFIGRPAGGHIRRWLHKPDGTGRPKRVDGIVASKHILLSRRMEKQLIAMIISMIIGAH
jgi:hypothetical protein